MSNPTLKMRNQIVLILLVLTSTRPCPALEGNRELRKFSAEQYVALPLLIAANGLAFSMSPGDTARWKGGILFDNGVRNGLRLDSKDARSTITTVGDLMLYSVIAYPIMVDAGLNLALSEKEGDLGGQVALISLQSFLVTTAVTLATKAMTSRERPYQQECATTARYDDSCDQEDSRQSFFSGHASLSFTGAGLICAAHETFDLWGGSAPCYGALGAATMIAMTRIMADKHYLSDVIVGATVGTLSGYLLPKLVHFNAGGRSATIAPVSSSRQVGLVFGLSL